MPQLDTITKRKYPYVNDPYESPSRFKIRAFVSDGRARFEITRVGAPEEPLMPVSDDAPLPSYVVEALVLVWRRFRTRAHKL